MYQNNAKLGDLVISKYDWESHLVGYVFDISEKKGHGFDIIKIRWSSGDIGTYHYWQIQVISEAG